MNESETIDITTIDKKMNVIIGLLSKMANGTEQTVKERIAELASYGLSNTEIASIIGKKSDYVSRELYKTRVAKKKK